MLVVHQLNIKIQKLGGMSPMKKYINIVGALGLIVLIMAMPFFYTTIFWVVLSWTQHRIRILSLAMKTTMQQKFGRVCQRGISEN